MPNTSNLEELERDIVKDEADLRIKTLEHTKQAREITQEQQELTTLEREIQEIRQRIAHRHTELTRLKSLVEKGGDHKATRHSSIF